MGVIKQSIKIESVLEDIFAYLPDVTFENGGSEYPVKFGYGDDVELNLFLKSLEGLNQYPLIWFLWPYEYEETKTNVKIEDAVFIIAVDTNNVMQNKERLSETYGKVLMPLFDNFKYVLKNANVTNTENKYKVTKHPNYGENDKAIPALTIWDALKIKTSFSINQNCLKAINFKL
jgi:hypothetical protein